MPSFGPAQQRRTDRMTDSTLLTHHLVSPAPTAVLILSNGAVFYGHGVGAVGIAVGEICFNTSMAGYQEILTDPSYAEQIITFTFPHIHAAKGSIQFTEKNCQKNRAP